MERSWWSPVAAQPRIELGVVADSDGRLPFLALLVFTFILLLAPQERIPALAPLRIAMLTALLAVMAHCWSRWRSGQALVTVNTSLLLLAALVGWALLTMPFSFWPGGSMAYLMENYLKTLIVFVLLANVLSSTEKLLTMAWALALMAIPLALTTLKNFLAGNAGRVMGYSASLTANPNDLALMLNLILPLVIALFLGTRKTSLRLLLAGVIGLLVLAVLATFSRAGFLALGFIVLCYLWLLRTRPERVFIPVVIVAVICALPLIPSDYYSRITTIVNIEEDTTNSAQIRLADMKVALGLIATHPVMGSGIGMNVLAMNAARGPTWTQVHNVYLQLAVELGLPGLALFLTLYVQCWRSTKWVLRQSRGHPRLQGLYNVTEGLQVSLMVFALEAIFHPVAYHYYFYYIAGMALAAGSICRRNLAGAGHEGVIVARQVGPGRSAIGPT
jgi:probable O-glycosylation ligase (exosortase A-associated)